MQNKLLLGVLATLSWADLKILSPQDLTDSIGNDGVVLSSLGNFGHITYGATTLG